MPLRQYKRIEDDGVLQSFHDLDKNVFIPDDMANTDRAEMQRQLDAQPPQAEILAADPPPAPPTDDELIQDLMTSNEQMRRIVKALALVVAEQHGLTNQQLKDAIKAKMNL